MAFIDLFRINNKVKIDTTQEKKREISKAKETLSRIRQDAQTRKDAITEAEKVYYPFRVKLQRMYLNTAENGFIHACLEKRMDLTLLRKWEFKNKGGEINKEVTAIFFNEIDGKYVKKQWFENFIKYCLDAKFYGYSLIYLGDIINGELVNTKLYPRANVSPDRFEAVQYVNMVSGVKFLTDPEYRDSYVYVATPNDYGISPCGYGEFFWLSIYEILLRNLMVFNANYTELNIAPFRQVKTNAQDDDRQDLYDAAVNMASTGVAVTDHTDEIIFHTSSGSGTGYIAFDNFEKRLEDKCSQIILGHADAMKSIAGKLGNDSADSPAQIAIRDKQTRDGDFIHDIVNNVLIPKLRANGFNIPDGVCGIMQNDNEEMDKVNNFADLAVKMQNAGLTMDGKYFTEQTNIPVQQMAKVPTASNISNVQNKLNKVYG